MTAGGIVILADDFTGAADTAAAFARTGARATVHRSAGGWELPADNVVSVALNSRDIDAEPAARRLRSALRRCRDVATFVKVDSLLRGNTAVTVAEVVRWSVGPVLIAPAHPAQGRATRGAVQYRTTDGKPVADVAALVPPRAGCDRIGLAALRSAGAPALTERLAAAQVAVADAETAEDLRRLAAAGECLSIQPVWVGSAGLAAAVAAAHNATASVTGVGAAGDPARCAPALPPLDGHSLFVIGSVSTPARIQLERLVARGQLRSFSLPVGDLVDRDHVAGIGTEIAEALLRGDVAVSAAPAGDRPIPGISRLLAAATAPALALARAAVLVGGDTAEAALGSIGVQRLAVRTELFDGVPVLEDAEDKRVVITKAGEFGGTDILVDIADRLERAHVRHGVLN